MAVSSFGTVYPDNRSPYDLAQRAHEALLNASGQRRAVVLMMAEHKIYERSCGVLTGNGME